MLNNSQDLNDLTSLIQLQIRKIKWHFKDFTAFELTINGELFYLEDGNATAVNNRLSLKQLK
jgi:hypothetical protein